MGLLFPSMILSSVILVGLYSVTIIRVNRGSKIKNVIIMTSLLLASNISASVQLMFAMMVPGGDPESVSDT